MIEVINIIGEENVVQVIIYNASVRKGVGMIIVLFPKVFRIPCVMPTLNKIVKEMM